MLLKSLIFIFTLIVVQMSKANHLTGFEIRQCANGSCYKATGPKSFVSNTQDFLSSPQVRLEIMKEGQPHGQEILCHSFSYDLVTQLLICDNQDVKRLSLSIDARLVVQKFNSP